jgi:hypothetical protein
VRCSTNVQQESNAEKKVDCKKQLVGTRDPPVYVAPREKVAVKPTRFQQIVRCNAPPRLIPDLLEVWDLA